MKKIGFIGLGKMGENMILNLLEKNYSVVVYNRHPEKTRKLAKHKNIVPSFSYPEFVSKIPKPRAIFIMVTAGKPVDEVMKNLTPLLLRGDIVIDGGNSHYEDSIRRHNMLEKKGVYFLDAGISGGIFGARHGASITAGGDKNAFKKTEQIFKDLSAKNGHGYFGLSGAGHFLKTIHNGIEYSLLESYAEGFEILNKSKYKFNLKNVSEVWSNGSVIRGFIMQLSEKIFSRGLKLQDVNGKIGGGETGTWAVEIAKKENVEAETIKHALMKRKDSIKKQSFSTKFVSAIRKEFGGHEEP